MTKQSIRTSLLKYPGGKTRELKKLVPLFPTDSNRFIDPFVGGGSVWISTNYKKNAINDFSKDLINLYNLCNSSSLLDYLNKVNKDLDAIQMPNSIINKLELESDLEKLYDIVMSFSNELVLFNDEINRNFKDETPKYLNRKLKYLSKHGLRSSQDTIDILQTSINASYYNAIRKSYNSRHENNEFRAFLYLFIREFCYSSMFRFSKNGHFNVPYGGKSYNKKRLDTHAEFYSSNLLNNKKDCTDIYNLDFQEFLNKIHPTSNDFIFLDPPYDSDFSSYDNNAFDKKEQERLANYVKSLSSKWLLVIKDTELIRSLYPSDKYNYIDYDKRYSVNFKNRNNQKVKHLVITNYPHN